ncbi:MAG: hypothetical protein Q9186_006837 [Xanthomendoza sp. 1 TL-2023]
MYRPQLLQWSQVESTLPEWNFAGPSVIRRIGIDLSFRSASSSSTRWQTRQSKDKFASKAKVEGLKSRAAYKLLEINEKHKIFKPGQTIVDLAGEWAFLCLLGEALLVVIIDKVAVDRTSPHGRVVGIDVIPAQPPAGVSTIQGNFLSPAVQDEVKKFLRANQDSRHNGLLSSSEQGHGVRTEDGLGPSTRNYFEQEKQSVVPVSELPYTVEDGTRARFSVNDTREGRWVDVVLSDMSAPWEQTEGFWKRSLSDPYYRMMNTSGINFKDHAGSMVRKSFSPSMYLDFPERWSIQDLCEAALRFAFDTLRSGGHFVCKFYQGAEDKALEARLRILFNKVHRDKPESSRNESKEAFFVALRRKADVRSADVFEQ